MKKVFVGITKRYAGEGNLKERTDFYVYENEFKAFSLAKEQMEKAIGQKDLFDFYKIDIWEEIKGGSCFKNRWTWKVIEAHTQS